MAKWNGKTKGNVLGYRIFIAAIKLFGIGGGYFILNFVSFYFYLFLGKQRKLLTDFYTNRVGLSPSIVQKTIRNNFIQIGRSIIDKIAFSVNRAERISYHEVGENYLRELASSKQGAFLISAHIGNWDVAGNLLNDINANVSVVMYQNEYENIQALLESQNSTPNFNIIPISNDLSHLIKIYTAIKKGDLVCMHADRYLEGAHTEYINFFGKPAKFPIGPFQLIEKLKVPYSFVFALKEEKYNYFFTASKPVYQSNKKAREIAVEFVSLLERKVKKYPDQWFNYYDFYTTY